MALQIGSGEAISEYAFFLVLVRRGLRRLAAGMRSGTERGAVGADAAEQGGLFVLGLRAGTGPITARKINITAGEMRTMEIEGG